MNIVMDIRSVLVESVDPKGESVYGNSGILLNQSHVITTFNAVAPFLSHSKLKNIDEKNSLGINYTKYHEIEKVSFFITLKNDENLFRSQKAHFEGYIYSKNISQSVNNIFRNWSIDSVDNHDFELLSLFIVLRLDNSGNDPKRLFLRLFEEMPKATVTKGDSLKCISAAFGNRDFLNHCSKGIVSNILGNDDCLIFSDLSLTPGSEGSPVFCDNLCEAPIGIVISAINWWKKEWLNFTVIADLRSLLLEFIESIKSTELKTPVSRVRFKLLSTMDSSLFQIYNGTIWGTAILINKEKGILITNAHVVDCTRSNILYRNNKPIPCDVVYASPENHHLDIAILKVKTKLKGPFQAVKFSKRRMKCGDIVYAAAFPIFPKETNAGATLTQGCISHIHPHMIKTTCSVYAGASGGAILDEEGGLVAIIVCNAKTSDQINMVYPKVNMNIPIRLLESILMKYIENEDMEILKDIAAIDASSWNFSSKL